MVNIIEKLDEPTKKQDIQSSFDLEKKMGAMSLHYLEEIQAKSPYLTREELEGRLNEHFNEILEAVKNDLDRRDESILELVRTVAREEIQIAQSPLKEQDDFTKVLLELKDSFNNSILPNPKIYFKEIDSQKLINVVIDDTDEYLNNLDVFSEIVNNFYMNCDLDLEFLLFEEREIKNPFNKQGFRQIK